VTGIKQFTDIRQNIILMQSCSEYYQLVNRHQSESNESNISKHYHAAVQNVTMHVPGLHVLPCFDQK